MCRSGLVGKLSFHCHSQPEHATSNLRYHPTSYSIQLSSFNLQSMCVIDEEGVQKKRDDLECLIMILVVAHACMMLLLHNHACRHCKLVHASCFMHMLELTFQAMQPIQTTRILHVRHHVSCISFLNHSLTTSLSYFLTL